MPGLPIERPEFQNAQQVYMTLQQVYGIYWMQHNFPYYEIQSLDVVQEPRMPQEKIAFQTALGGNLLRYWQMTNTRYVFGFVGLESWLNQFIDPEKQSFHERLRFTMHQEKAEGAILVETNSTGPFTLIEFTHTLPRAKLYTQWQVDTNLENVLKTIGSPSLIRNKQSSSHNNYLQRFLPQPTLQPEQSISRLQADRH